MELLPADWPAIIAPAMPFTVAWWMMAGNDRFSAAAGGVVLALLLITYSHFLGPVGLPSEPVRLLAENSPPADVHWLSYREEFLVMLPLTALVAATSYLLAAHWLGGRRRRPVARVEILTGIAAAAGLAILGASTAADLGSEANQLSISSAGPGSVALNGQGNMASTGPAALRMSVANRNTHRSPPASARRDPPRSEVRGPERT